MLGVERGEEDSQMDEKLAQAFAKTRKSLIARLGDWEDQKSWGEFYQIYWRLIYSVAVKAGLRSDEAFDCVQETILSIAKQSKKNQYDPEQGSFKNWLMNMTRWRISDQFRKRNNNLQVAASADDHAAAAIERVEDPGGDILSRIWDMEWKKSLADVALSRVRAQVSPRQYQIFDCYVIKQWELKKIQESLNVTSAQIYLAKYRVGMVLKKELSKLQEDAG